MFVLAKYTAIYSNENFITRQCFHNIHLYACALLPSFDEHHSNLNNTLIIVNCQRSIVFSYIVSFNGRNSLIAGVAISSLLSKILSISISFYLISLI